ncbi:hypothetical protein ARALYDRAFT_915624 [Arabidopsis lyrata subsp. lyrata]|uniref:Uncharacterized protein n=1 Tax=Arabidopsis lyrata subsp. lyrata TaxID=81972 RepID=D7MHM6_ARALL|nr:hypothetical protein ARALYDRAFT_915624 [Arabidopsis lyrata subsp. lyrata]
MASKIVAAKDIITLHGSVAIVSELFCVYFQSLTDIITFRFCDFFSETTNLRRNHKTNLRRNHHHLRR